jgi:peptidyl-prolyl cis-trans isomerase C
MPILVNGELVAEAIINEEYHRVANSPTWLQIPDETERGYRMRWTAELAATDRTLIQQLATLDTRPIESALLDQELEKLRPHFPAGLSEETIRQALERKLRAQRFREELVAQAVKPTNEEIELFYYHNRENFRVPELITAAHIIKHINSPEDYEPAFDKMKLALGELAAGADFEDVAFKYSDCPENGGVLAEFAPGKMVPEFEEAIALLQPGERTGIFETPFGLHIATLISRKSQGVAELHQVYRDIERVMTFAKQHELYIRRMEELRMSADIRRLGN